MTIQEKYIMACSFLQYDIVDDHFLFESSKYQSDQCNKIICLQIILFIFWLNKVIWYKSKWHVFVLFDTLCYFIVSFIVI